MASSMRRTNLQRQIDQYERQLEEQAQKIAQEELNRLFRAVQLKVRRVGRMRPGIGAPRLRLRKAEVVDKTSMWQIFLDRMMSRLMEALLSGYITLQGLITMRVTGEPLELDTDLIAQSLQSQLATRITHTTKTLKREVGRKIVSWYNTPGMTNQDIIKQLQPAFGAARASLISRTEITRLDALVQENTARQLGIDEWWWMTKRDQLVCKRPINGPDGKRYNGCRDLHGKHFKIGDKMPPDGSHPGCRCKAILISKPEPSVNDTPIVDISHLTKAEWDESKHPRASDGRFDDKAGAGKTAEPGHELSTATSKISKLSTKYKLPQYEIVETKLPKGEFGHHTKSTVMVDIDNIRESLKSPKYDVKEWFGISDDSLESVVLNTVLHEIGHEWYRNASKKSEDLVLLPSGNKGRVETSPVIRSWNEIYDKAKISGHSAYYKLPHESFADAFALYMTGEDLPELVENWFNDNIEVRGEVRKADFEESEHPRDEDGKFAPKGTGVKGIDKERSEAYDSQEEALQVAENHLGNGRPVATYKVKQPKLVTDISKEISRWRTPKWLNDESRYKDMAKQVFENRLATDVKDEGKGRSVDEYREELFTKFHSMVDNQPLRIRVRIQHIEILLSEDEERYKTQFETGVSGGLLDNSRRSQAELEGLNIPEHIDARYRPTYGYINDTMGDPSHYGKVGFILNESVKKRATITLDDSLRGMGTGYLPIPFNQIVPGRAANDPEELMYVGACIGNKTHTIRKGKVPSWGYIEAQIQGGWHMGEVTGAVFYKDCFKSDGTLEPEYAKLEAKLKDRGIEVEYNANKE